MEGEAVQDRARQRADELPGAGWEQPFGPEWDVCKVRGKVFMLMTDHHGESIVTLKADPEVAKALQSEHVDITPGYHMNKRHWITLHPGGSITAALVDELVTESYRLVVEKLPRVQRPVDPATFGLG
ncbi:hypothetical protein ABA31_04140 [Agrococcus baldri]|uniref:Cytoplasmic protein n=2 Tax=Agrococcus baldri TaxID=153730 RepID=A0AA87UQU6_9MICO|nr:hypothetical protein ABA31_04140 [Agrococcus baldri]